jgi:tetratricopeptide (TPR) repeat protein
VLFERISAADPSNVQAQRDVALAYVKGAQIDRDEGRLEAAIGPAMRAVRMFEAMTAADPRSASLQIDLSAACSLAGDIRLQQGAIAEARSIFTRMTALQEDLAAQDPGNAEMQYAVAIAYSQMGEVVSAEAGRLADGLARRERWRQARDWLTRSLTIFTRLQEQGVLTGADAEQPARVTRLVERCDRALASSP